MRTRLFTITLAAAVGLAGCNAVDKSASTVRPTKPDDPSEEVPASVSRLLPEEITAENYQSKIAQFERELARDGRKTPEPSLAENK